MSSAGRRPRDAFLDAYIVQRHLERVLAEYIDHYNHARPHQGIEQRRPCEPADVIPLPTGRVERRDRLGGVLREYSRAAA